MHVERNVSNNILKHVMEEKDSPAERHDMEEAGLFPRLSLQREGETRDYIMPHAPSMLTARETSDFVSLIIETRVPTCYSSTLTKHVGEHKLAGLKSHDHYCLVQ